jgi:ABC-type antimicrobial peptide transport system permease subunit
MGRASLARNPPHTNTATRDAQYSQLPNSPYRHQSNTCTTACFLFGVSAFDPVTFVAASILLALVALLAAYVPAHRAANLDPILTLRSE